MHANGRRSLPASKSAPVIFNKPATATSSSTPKSNFNKQGVTAKRGKSNIPARKKSTQHTTHKPTTPKLQPQAVAKASTRPFAEPPELKPLNLQPSIAKPKTKIKPVSKDVTRRIDVKNNPKRNANNILAAPQRVTMPLNGRTIVISRHNGKTTARVNGGKTIDIPAHVSAENNSIIAHFALAKHQSMQTNNLPRSTPSQTKSDLDALKQIGIDYQNSPEGQKAKQELQKVPTMMAKEPTRVATRDYRVDGYPEMYRIGDVIYNAQTRQINIDGHEPIKLTPQEGKLMAYMCQHGDSSVHYMEIQNVIYGSNADKKHNVFGSLIRKVREKLGNDHNIFESGLDGHARLLPSNEISQAIVKPDRLLTLGPVGFAPDGTITVNGEIKTLTSKQKSLLLYLMETPGLKSLREINQHMHAYYGSLTDNNIQSSVSLINDALGIDVIHSRMGLGYEAYIRLGSKSRSTLKVGAVIIDQDHNHIKVHGQEIILQQKQYELLKYLMQFEGNSVDRTQIIEHLSTLKQAFSTKSISQAAGKINTMLGFKYVEYNKQKKSFSLNKTLEPAPVTAIVDPLQFGTIQLDRHSDHSIIGERYIQLEPAKKALLELLIKQRHGEKNVSGFISIDDLLKKYNLPDSDISEQKANLKRIINSISDLRRLLPETGMHIESDERGYILLEKNEPMSPRPPYIITQGYSVQTQKGSVKIDLNSKIITLDNQIVSMTDREWAVLSYLVKRNKQSISQLEIIQNAIQGSIMPQEAAGSAAAKIREKLGKDIIKNREKGAGFHVELERIGSE
jgi:DNA-binding response OmpR family regulator